MRARARPWDRARSAPGRCRCRAGGAGPPALAAWPAWPCPPRSGPARRPSTRRPGAPTRRRRPAGPGVLGRGVEAVDGVDHHRHPGRPSRPAARKCRAWECGCAQCRDGVGAAAGTAQPPPERRRGQTRSAWRGAAPCVGCRHARVRARRCRLRRRRPRRSRRRRTRRAGARAAGTGSCPSW